MSSQSLTIEIRHRVVAGVRVRAEADVDRGELQLMTFGRHQGPGADRLDERADVVLVRAPAPDPLDPGGFQ